MSIPILLVEDSGDDAETIRLSLRMAGVGTPVITVSDGDEAIAYLSGQGQFSDRASFPIPRVLLLDLNMCRVDGFDVLEWIRTQPQLSDLYVVVLSGHHGLREVNQAYALGAKSFLFKPGEPAQIRELITNSRRHWSDSPSDPTPPPPPPPPPLRPAPPAPPVA